MDPRIQMSHINQTPQYQIIKTIGKGTYGTVYLCNSNKTNSQMVLKEVHVNSTKDDKYKEAINEIKILSTLIHPFIIRYLESFYQNHSVYIIMEYANQGNLAEYMFKRQHYLLPQNEILIIFCQVLLGVQHMHMRNIVHRDLKAENILMSGTYGNTVKIGDFGIAKILDNDKASTVIGTPYYLAPELCENKPYDSKTDIWALGCLFYEMCTHKRAFDAPTLIGLVKEITTGNFIPINTSYYEHEIQAIIDHMLTVVPEKRCCVNVILEKQILRPILEYIHVIYLN
ncbi:serine/threonine-protein kinase Nek8-like [Arctopsyche grandis]|uniref:serine/threonine-protein kinase Nek8-like n=1 Tax=Arctopsyche grandis TaxID=121162 RepID=UPI00406D70EA